MSTQSAALAAGIVIDFIQAQAQNPDPLIGLGSEPTINTRESSPNITREIASLLGKGCGCILI